MNSPALRGFMRKVRWNDGLSVADLETTALANLLDRKWMRSCVRNSMACWAKANEITHFRYSRPRFMTQRYFVMAVDYRLSIDFDEELASLAPETITFFCRIDNSSISLDEGSLAVLTVALLSFRSR